eukprot:TRINITY_DN49435_c0_g1_i1.p1 TRINITY_DN49435_c0_g1~~TRINITY_DN49435_c0_g1_i1.p1  ORF type:complete len:633 (+),score=95.95 TRINITY_DN49435_c0_g1_i1:66-1901(+)
MGTRSLRRRLARRSARGGAFVLAIRYVVETATAEVVRTDADIDLQSSPPWPAIRDHVCGQDLPTTSPKYQYAWSGRLSTLDSCLGLCSSTAACRSAAFFEGGRDFDDAAGVARGRSAGAGGESIDGWHQENCRLSFFCGGDTEARFLSFAEGWVTHFKPIQVPRSSAPLNSLCNAVNQLESLVDSIAFVHGGLDFNAVAAAYDESLRALSASTPAADSNAPELEPASGMLRCRTAHLGRDLCRRATVQLSSLERNLTAGGASRMWAHLMMELGQLETTHCDIFHRLPELSGSIGLGLSDQSHISFPLWHWNAFVPQRWLRSLQEHPSSDWILEGLRRGGLHGGVAAPVTTEVAVSPAGKRTLQVYNNELLEKAMHVMVLESAGIHLKRFGCVLDVGGGSAALARLLPLLDYTGRHVILDLPPMHLMQHYLLRLHGQAAYFADDLGDTSLPKRAVLLARLGSAALRRQLREIQGPTLLVATYSLCEMTLAARRLLLHEVRARGVDAYLLAFYEYFEGVNNLADVLNMVEEEGGLIGFAEFSVCVWSIESNARMRYYYLAAIRRELGAVRCSSWAGCNPDTVLLCHDDKRKIPREELFAESMAFAREVMAAGF